MRISIVIPAYNEERYLPNCLSFVLAERERFSQSNPDIPIDVVVVDNASTDRTRTIAENLGVRVVYEKNKGLVQARRAGFNATNGDVVANVDADTQMPPGWLTIVAAAFSEDSSLVALSGPYRYYDLNSFVRFWIRFYYAFGWAIGAVAKLISGKGAMLQGGNFIIRRDAWKRVGGFDTSIEFYGEDTDVARRISSVGTVKWSWQLEMDTTARRFKAEGVIASAYCYGKNFLSTLFFKVPVSHTYTDVRS